jgi:hypothetical protein
MSLFLRPLRRKKKVFSERHYIRGERKLGENWTKRPKNPGTRTKGGGDGAGDSLLLPPADIPTLAGLEKKRAARDVTFGRSRQVSPRQRSPRR